MCGIIRSGPRNWSRKSRNRHAFQYFGEEDKPPFEPFNWLWCEYRKRGILPMNAPGFGRLSKRGLPVSTSNHAYRDACHRSWLRWLRQAGSLCCIISFVTWGQNSPSIANIHMRGIPEISRLTLSERVFVDDTSENKCRKNIASRRNVECASEQYPLARLWKECILAGYNRFLITEQDTEFSGIFNPYATRNFVSRRLSEIFYPNSRLALLSRSPLPG